MRGQNTKNGADRLYDKTASMLDWFAYGNGPNSEIELVINGQQTAEKSSFVRDIIMGKQYERFEIVMNKIGARLSDVLAANELSTSTEDKVRKVLRRQFIDSAIEELKNSTNAIYDDENADPLSMFDVIVYDNPEQMSIKSLSSDPKYSEKNRLLGDQLHDIDNKYKEDLEVYFGRMFDLAYNLRTSEQDIDKVKRAELDSLIQGKKMWDMIISYASKALAAGMIILAAAIGFAHEQINLDQGQTIVAAVFIVLAAAIVLDFGSVLFPAQNRNQYGEKMMDLLHELETENPSSTDPCIVKLNEIVKEIHKEAKSNLKIIEQVREKALEQSHVEL